MRSATPQHTVFNQAAPERPQLFELFLKYLQFVFFLISNHAEVWVHHIFGLLPVCLPLLAVVLHLWVEVFLRTARQDEFETILTTLSMRKTYAVLHASLCELLVGSLTLQPPVRATKTCRELVS